MLQNIIFGVDEYLFVADFLNVMLFGNSPIAQNYVKY